MPPRAGRDEKVVRPPMTLGQWKGEDARIGGMLLFVTPSGEVP